MATKDVKEFNGWFNRSYARLKESSPSMEKSTKTRSMTRISGCQEADNVLKCRDRRSGVLFLRMLPKNPAVGRKGWKPLRQPWRRVFRKTGWDGLRGRDRGTEEMLTGCDRLVRDIQKFLRRHFSYEDYRIFMLRFYETGSSFRTIARHMGEKTSVVTRRGTGDDGIHPGKPEFIAQRRLIMAGEAA